MRKIYVCLIFSSLFFLSSSAQEEVLYQFSHDYFRTDPFNGQFSAFMQRLLNDPAIQDKDSKKRSDTSLFYFFGTYKNYNPFFFKPKRVEILLEETVIAYSDSVSTKDTILVYQLMAYNDNTDAGKREIKKEVDKINRQYNKKFFDRKFKEIKKGETVNGEIHNYFLQWYGLAPLSIAWINIAETKEVVLNITMRMKTSDNLAVLAAPLYNSK